MSTPTRYLAGIVAAAVTAAGLAVAVPSSAHAAEDGRGATLTWGFSPYLEAGAQLGPVNPTGNAVIGADSDGNQAIVFSKGQGMAPASDGATDLTYTGSIEFASPYDGSDGNPLYEVTFTDPEVKTAADGTGQIVADVSWNVTGTAGSADDLTVVTFGAGFADWDGRTLTATPDWAGVVPADTYGTGKPVDGKSWDPDFVTALPSSIQAFFYASGSGSDAQKQPSEFTAEAAAPVLTPTVTSSTPAGGVTWSVTGSGFRGVTEAGDAGVYVGLAPAGGLPDVSSQAGMAAFAAAAYVPTVAITDGAFTTTLTAPTDKLDPSTSYSLYTWQAHTHSNTTQDTETPVTIDWDSLAVHQTTLTVSGPASTTYGAPATLSVALPAAATGTVTLTGVGATQTATASNGTAAFAVPATLPAGSYTATFAYAGDGSNAAATTTRAFTVERAAVGLRATWKKKPSLRKKGKLVVTATGVAGATAPTGTVSAVLTHGKKKVTVKARPLTGGKVKLKVKKLPKKGAWKASVSYAGDTDYAATTAKAKKVKATR